jgi:ABC-type oligopeptide transport system ATPase subunit
MYKLSAVTKNYHKGRSTVAALRGVDLVIEDGEWLAVQGPTGHGKSTLLQILGGLDRPSAGIVEFDGRDLAQLREAEMTKVRAQSIGFVFQTFQPGAHAVRPGECGGRAGAAARRFGRPAAAGHHGAGGRRPRRPAPARARRAVRRPAAARRHSAGPGQGAQGPAGRRAHRQPGRGHPGRDHRPARDHVARARPDHGPRHPRQQHRPPRPADRRDEERPPGLQAVPTRAVPTRAVPSGAGRPGPGGPYR